MFPYITIGWYDIYMTWLWIFFSVLCFIFLVSHYWNKYPLNFWRFFNFVPVILFLPYFFWSYFYYLVELWLPRLMNLFDYTIQNFVVWNVFSLIYQFINIIPMSSEDWLLIISPYWYKFHFIWVSIWLFLAIFIFFKFVKSNNEALKRIDIFFYAISLSIIPLWIFLLLWDNFIWRATDSIWWVTSFMEDSELYKYDKVYPVGLFVSFVWLFSFFFSFFINYLKKKYGIGMVWFISLLLLMNIPFFFQQYPRHLVFTFCSVVMQDSYCPDLLSEFKLDIKNYWTIIMSIIIFIYYRKIQIGQWN